MGSMAQSPQLLLTTNPFMARHLSAFDCVISCAFIGPIIPPSITVYAVHRTYRQNGQFLPSIVMTWFGKRLEIIVMLQCLLSDFFVEHKNI